MKRHLLGFLCLGAMGLLSLSSCQKAPELTLTGPASIELSADGSSGTITFTANRDWTASASDSWVSISPSSGTASDGMVIVSVRCNANTTYDDRTATVTIKMEELSQSVTIKQPANLGIILATQAYDLASDARTLEITVQANVQYSVAISGNWIKQTGTKGLTTDKLTFSIEENKTYDSREGKITIKSQNSSVQDQVITVKQAQKDALIIKDTSFDMPYGGGEIEVKVEANVEFEVKPDVDWIHHVETKALSNSTIRLTVDENPTFENRSGKIEVKQKNGELSYTITVNQAQRIAVTSVELNKTNLRINAGDSETLVATVKPDNATDKTVTWTSSDEAVATVDETGKVTAVKEGAATITAKAGEKAAECKVTVYVAVTSVELNKTTLSLNEGDTETLTATVKPDNATDKTVTWSSSDEKIATVKDGKVTAVKIGEATIKATVGDKTAECKVTVNPVPVSSVELNKESLTLTVGEDYTLTALVKPDNATNKTVSWASNDPSIVSVDNGKLKANSLGKVTITASCDGVSADCVVSVVSEEDLNLESNVSIALTGTGYTVSSGGAYYTRYYTITNDSLVDIDVYEIGTTNYIPLNATIPAGSSYVTSLYFSYNVYPTVTVRFRHNGYEYSISGGGQQ